MESPITEFGHVHSCKWGFQSKILIKIANSVDPDETADEQSHLDLHYLHRYMFWSAKLKGLTHMQAKKAMLVCTQPGRPWLVSEDTLVISGICFMLAFTFYFEIKGHCGSFHIISLNVLL